MNRIKKITAVLVAAIMAVLSTSIVSADTTMVSNIEGVPAGDYTYVRDKIREGINLVNSVDSEFDFDNIMDTESGMIMTNVVSPLVSMSYNSNNVYTKLFCLNAVSAVVAYGTYSSTIGTHYANSLRANPYADTSHLSFEDVYSSDYYKQNMTTVYNSYQELFAYRGTIQGFDSLLDYKIGKLDAMFGVE